MCCTILLARSNVSVIYAAYYHHVGNMVELSAGKTLKKMGVCEKCSLGSTNEVAEQEAFESLSTKRVSEMGR